MLTRTVLHPPVFRPVCLRLVSDDDRLCDCVSSTSVTDSCCKRRMSHYVSNSAPNDHCAQASQWCRHPSLSLSAATEVHDGSYRHFSFGAHSVTVISSSRAEKPSQKPTCSLGTVFSFDASRGSSIIIQSSSLSLTVVIVPTTCSPVPHFSFLFTSVPRRFFARVFLLHCGRY